MLRQGGTKRSGFTLPEVLVTVAIVSVLAAIVVPTVTSQIGKGDDTRFATSITNVRTGITAFVSDTRRFPGRLSDLYNTILATDNDLFGSPYGAAVAARWKGPYTSGALAAGGCLPLSLGCMQDALLDSSVVGPPNSGYVIASLNEVLSQALAARLDTLVDQGTDSLAGILQWRPAAAGAVDNGAVKLQLMGSR